MRFDPSACSSEDAGSVLPVYVKTTAAAAGRVGGWR